MPGYRTAEITNGNASILVHRIVTPATKAKLANVIGSECSDGERCRKATAPMNGAGADTRECCTVAYGFFCLGGGGAHLGRADGVGLLRTTIVTNVFTW
jgi:hypothetical protein